MSKKRRNILKFTCFGLATLASPYFCLASDLTLGFAFPGLHEKEISDKELLTMKSLSAKWIRLTPHSGDPGEIESLARTTRMANDAGLHVLLNILQLDADYDRPLERNVCGWNSKPLSQIKLEKFQARLAALFSTMHAAGAHVDAVEVGNEYDQECYDGDVEIAMSEWLRGYAKFLRAAARELKKPSGFPTAKIITFGIAQIPNSPGSPPHIFQPLAAVLSLANLDGYNYLSNDEYKIEGIGLHVYASPSNLEGDITEMLVEQVRKVPLDYTVWVTEWGFLHKAFFSASRPLDKYVGPFLSQLHRVQCGRLGPLFYYNFEWLLDKNGTPAKAAHIFAFEGKSSREREH